APASRSSTRAAAFSRPRTAPCTAVTRWCAPRARSSTRPSRLFSSPSRPRSTDMANDRGDDLKGQLGTFMRAALAQMGTVNAVVEKSKAGRIQLDVAILKRQRKEVLVELGEIVIRLAHAGRISEEDFPELGAPLARLDALDERIELEAERARRVARGAPDPADPAGAGPEHLDSDKETE